ncbi:hypothetical protein Poli38472_006410 [Pythium oligandrum]|uniref:Sel1 repeat family protein n=1 Tax=Pythium oligandrum TaxID=41045 RepID=A0A8K1FAM8_PYTOL|nr:hypothetical protein Poli38472_006410 [Pythium oligandrum]|eukprot:TMW56400.1 hypothetical protein Poli38472_006410 [Pythium oligandrum]
MLRSLRSAWRRKKIDRAREASKELDGVLKELRQLGQRTTFHEFQESPMVAQLKDERQFFNLGKMIYNNANDNPEEIQKAMFLWRKAMKIGSVPAKYSMAVCLKTGVGVPERDMKTAVKYFQELSATGHKWGMFGYADALSKGDGTRRDTKKAFELFLKAAKGDVPPAFYNVASMYLAGTGVAKNEAEGIKWLQKAAETGDPQAKSTLAELYFHGKGVPKDVKKAVLLYKQAAIRGVVTAQFNLGFLFLTGEGVPQDSLEAEGLLRRAAEQGFVMAMVNLAQMYRYGHGEVPQNVDLAKQWLALAAPHDSNAKELLEAIENEKVGQ